MTDCDELVEQLHAQADTQIRLAMIAQTPVVAEMHLDLAEWNEAQANAAEELCDEGMSRN